MTGKQLACRIGGKDMTYNNQRCRDWTHPYQWEGEGNLHDSGCGIFSLCHIAQWLTGKVQQPEAWADFACTYGGRGDDGTDRPELLSAIIREGRNEELGFCCPDPSLQNDKDKLFHLIYDLHGAALCNLRLGHIVALVDARIVDGQKQLLVIDSYSESASDKVRNSVCEVLEQTAISYDIRNDAGLVTGTGVSYGAFWVDAQLPMNFNLLEPLQK
ncbi:MAG: hypothetical protein Q4C54_09475 [Clostridia bacterium]|nr:hypothetical protein [Clostridia bacterium]